MADWTGIRSVTIAINFNNPKQRRCMLWTLSLTAGGEPRAIDVDGVGC